MASTQDRKWSIDRIHGQFLTILLVITLVLGISFRFLEIGRKVYWHDEAYTSLRAAGFTRQEIDNKLFTNRAILAGELQEYQQFKPGSTIGDTVRSLALETPQHPPLYFLMARFWMQQFGSSITASRLLPATISLLALPLIYALAWELFSSPQFARLATVLFAVSPFDILFAQTARQYSLLTAITIGSSWLLLRACRYKNWQNWGSYTIAIVLGLYTHLFFILTLIAQGCFMVILSFSSGSNPQENSSSFSPDRKDIIRFFQSSIVAFFLYIPWLFIFVLHLNRAVRTTNWLLEPVSFVYRLKMWILSFTCLFIDIDFGFDNIYTYALRLPFLLLIGFAIYQVCRHSSFSTKIFILTSIIVPFLLLALPDFWLGGKRSTITRYLISCFPGIQLAVSYFLVTRKQTQKWIYQTLLVTILTSSILSNTLSTFSNTWWSKDLSYFNADVAQIVNQIVQSSPVNQSVAIVSDPGDEDTNLGQLLSLSYLVNRDSKWILLSHSPDLKLLDRYNKVLVFNPSPKLRTTLEKTGGKLEPVVPHLPLWRWQ